MQFIQLKYGGWFEGGGGCRRRENPKLRIIIVFDEEFFINLNDQGCVFYFATN